MASYLKTSLLVQVRTYRSSSSIAEPSPKYLEDSFLLTMGVPVSRSTVRMLLSPHWPVVSYRVPSWKNSPCVYARGSCGYSPTTFALYSFTCALEHAERQRKDNITICNLIFIQSYYFFWFLMQLMSHLMAHQPQKRPILRLMVQFWGHQRHIVVVIWIIVVHMLTLQPQKWWDDLSRRRVPGPRHRRTRALRKVRTGQGTRLRKAQQGVIFGKR